MNVRPLCLDGGSIRELLDEEIAEWGTPTSVGNMFEYIEQNCDRANIMVGTIPCDGNQINDTTYPDAVAAVRAGKQKAVTEAEWQADPKKRFMWSLGGGSGPTAWVRPPDLNGVQPGSLKPAYIRGAATDAQVGAGHDSSMQGHIHGNTGSGTPNAGQIGVGGQSNTGVNVQPTTGPRADGTNGEPKVSDETRGVGAHYLWTVRVFGTVSNPGAVDAAQLATDLAVANAKIATLESKQGDIYAYPNSGTEASPANISINSRYVVANPFPGFKVGVEVQILYEGVWCVVRMGGSGAASYGAEVAQHSDGTLVLITGTQYMITASALHYFSGVRPASANVAASLPSRLSVHKL
nr:hypothetical protein [uncultured Comamonas sp.]